MKVYILSEEIYITAGIERNVVGVYSSLGLAKVRLELAKENARKRGQIVFSGEADWDVDYNIEGWEVE